jgi:hypothetical protein
MSVDTQVVNRETQCLNTVDAAWSTLDPEDRVAFRAEWHDLMDVVGHLAAASEAGRLDEANERDLREVARTLTAALPLMERTRLRLPDPDVQAQTRLAARGWPPRVEKTAHVSREESGGGQLPRPLAHDVHRFVTVA